MKKDFLFLDHWLPASNDIEKDNKVEISHQFLRHAKYLMCFAKDVSMSIKVLEFLVKKKQSIALNAATNFYKISEKKQINWL